MAENLNIIKDIQEVDQVSEHNLHLEESPVKKSAQITKKGIPASSGIAAGRAFIIQSESSLDSTERISNKDIPSELSKLDTSISTLLAEFSELLEKVRLEAGNVASIIESGNLILSDSYIKELIRKRIQSGFSAASAIIQEFDEQKMYLEASGDPILKERAIDLDHTKRQLLSALRNKVKPVEIPKNSIIVAESLTPQDIVYFKEAGVKAIVTEAGGIASHSSILCRSFEIPAVIGIKNATSQIRHGSDILIDGFSGIIICNPDAETKKTYRRRIKEEELRRETLGSLIKLPCRTLDGVRIKILTNIDIADDINLSLQVGAEGFGLVRTENLLMSVRGFPTEDEQSKWYEEIANRAYPELVNLRAFDIGGDKYPKGMARHEENPALGYRGIRFLLKRRDIFITQLKAILRSSKNKNVRLLLPMISNIDELDASLELLKAAKLELESNNMDFDKNLPVGVMVETPSAAILADRLAQKCSFFSIGTNDLTQYTLAADRTNEFVNDVYDPFHPSVLRLIKMTVDAAKRRNIPVSICGELAGHSASTQLLIGLGIQEFSVSPSILLETKHRILETDSIIAAFIAEKAILCDTHNEVRELLEV